MDVETTSAANDAARSPAPMALFLTGPSGTGKSALAQAWVRHRIAKGEAWCLLDKDLIGQRLGARLMTLLGGAPEDRDSPLYKREVRDLDYQTTLDLARAQLELGVNVVLPAPWTKELTEGVLFRPEKWGAPADTKSLAVWLQLSEDERKKRIIERAHPQDAWKIKFWGSYSKAAGSKRPTCKGGTPFVLPADRPLEDLVAALESLTSEEDDEHLMQWACPLPEAKPAAESETIAAPAPATGRIFRLPKAGT